MKTNELTILKNRLPKHFKMLGRDRFFNAAILVPFIKLSDGYHLLFQQRADTIKQGTEICFPGGMFDSKVDAGYQETAIRETVEELGIDKNKIKIEGILGTLISPTGIAIETYPASLNIKDLNELNINANEVKRVFTLPLNYLKGITPEHYKSKVHSSSSYIDPDGKEIILLPVEKLGLPKKYLTPWGGKQHRILVYKTKEGIIWGITAEIIHELLILLDYTSRGNK